MTGSTTELFMDLLNHSASCAHCWCITQLLETDCTKSAQPLINSEGNCQGLKILFQMFHFRAELWLKRKMLQTIL